MVKSVDDLKLLAASLMEIGVAVAPKGSDPTTDLAEIEAWPPFRTLVAVSPPNGWLCLNGAGNYVDPPLPRTLVIRGYCYVFNRAPKWADDAWPQGGLLLDANGECLAENQRHAMYSEPEETLVKLQPQVLRELRFDIDEEVVVAPIADEPEWVYAAWWGDGHQRPLDNARAIADAKTFLDYTEIEEDGPKSEDFISSRIRELRNWGEPEAKIRKEIAELRNYRPQYDEAHSAAYGLLCMGISRRRATRMLSQWNRDKNPRPIPEEDLCACVAGMWEGRCGHFSFHDIRPYYRRRYYKHFYGDADPLTALLEAAEEPDDLLMGGVLSTDQRTMLYAASGKGKTVLSLAIAAHIAAGRDFLHWQGPGKSRRVLYIDGEMGQKNLGLRLKDTLRRLKQPLPPGSLHAITKEQYPQLREGIDTPEGQDWLEDYIEKHGPFDLIVFDSINTLSACDTIGAAGWKQVNGWSLELTERKVAQLFVHHTGADGGREYGTIMRRNDMDTVVKVKPLAGSKGRLAFGLEFDKTRFGDRRPDDFETAQITLEGDEWTTSGGANPTGERVELIRAKLEEHGIVGEAKGLGNAALAKLMSDNAAEQETWRNRLNTYARRAAYNALCRGDERLWFLAEERVP